MNSLFISVKVINSQCDIINRLEQSLNDSERKYYNVNETDKGIITKLEKKLYYKIVFIVFSDDEKGKYEAEKIYLGRAKRNEMDNLKYEIIGSLDSKLVINNYILNSGLDLKEDFDNCSYINLETSSELMNQLEFIVNKSYRVKPLPYEAQNYISICKEESTINKYGQKNIHCKRAIANLEADNHRSEFQRDRERIVHAKASRRLVDKAQIFTSSKGDHYRTRMIHTLEVSQIARGIAKTLELNVDLTEAIALAHDIGHTPFGHQGERTLNDILRNKIQIIKESNNIKFGGFKHNFHGLRVLSYIEEKYMDHEGLDLSYQVLEGVLKHTGGKVKKCPCDSCDNNCYDVSEFLINGNDKYLFLDYHFPTTLEGQIVKIADEIAQRGHDLDDAFASQHLDFEELSNHSQIRKMKPIKDIIDEIIEEVDELENMNRIFIDKNDMLRSRLVSEILGFFMKDVVKKSKENMNSYNESNFYKSNHRFNKVLIEFSKDGQFIIDYLEKIISKKVINSFEVARFDEKAKTVITELFRSYYANPKLLPDTTLMRIYREIKEISDNIIDFRFGNPKLISKELHKICSGVLYEGSISVEEQNEYTKKRIILVRNIVDHIAGMTDNYALNEYKELVSMSLK